MSALNRKVLCNLLNQSIKRLDSREMGGKRLHTFTVEERRLNLLSLYIRRDGRVYKAQEISKDWEKEIRALFGRKLCDLKELKQLTDQAIKEGRKGQLFTI